MLHLTFRPGSRQTALLFSLRRHAVTALAAIGLMANTASAASVRLTEPQTGLTVVAPNGYHIVYGNGVYRLFNSKNYVRFMLARSPLNLANTATSFVKLSKIRVSSKKSSKSSVTILGKLKGKSVKVVLKPYHSFINIVTYGSGTGASRLEAQDGFSQQPEALTAGQQSALDNILKTLRGGVSTPLQVPIPVTTRRCADGTRVTMPTNWGAPVCGGGGIVSGANLSQGAFGFGIPSGVSLPGFGGQFQSNIPNSQPAANLIFTVWPQYISFSSGGKVQIQVLQVVPVINGWLGGNFIDSSLCRVQFLLNGQLWQGLISSGVFDYTGTAFAWYHSYIAVPQGGPGGFGPALLNTWASWDNSAASTARINQAIRTLLSIRMPGGPIDPDVFEAAANAWDAYIRE